MARKPRGPDKKVRSVSPWTSERRIAAGSVLRDCLVCDAEFWVSKAQRQKFKGGGRYCSRDCKHLGVGDALRGQPLTGKLVTRHSAGYLLEWAPGHPRASRSRVLQHLLVMEAVLGRPLKPNEEVHHANGRRDDNWPDNLEVWVKGEHQRMHAQKPGVREAMSARMKRRVQARDGTSGRFVS